jgi:hypothetical protein
MDLTNHIFKYNYPEGESRQGANAAVRIDVLNENKSMSGPFIDTYWHGMLKTPGTMYVGPVKKQHEQSDDTVEVVDIDLSDLPPGTRYLRLYAYNLRPHEDKGERR